MKYRDLDGKIREGSKPCDSGPCAACGMPVYRAEYHPWAACMMFKQSRNSDSVRGNLEAVIQFGVRQGRGSGKRRGGG